MFTNYKSKKLKRNNKIVDFKKKSLNSSFRGTSKLQNFRSIPPPKQNFFRLFSPTNSLFLPQRVSHKFTKPFWTEDTCFSQPKRENFSLSSKDLVCVFAQCYALEYFFKNLNMQQSGFLLHFLRGFFRKKSQNFYREKITRTKIRTIYQDGACSEFQIKKYALWNVYLNTFYGHQKYTLLFTGAYVSSKVCLLYILLQTYYVRLQKYIQFISTKCPKRDKYIFVPKSTKKGCSQDIWFRLGSFKQLLE